MPSRSRHLLVASLLLVLSLALVATGVVRSAWLRMSAVLSPRRSAASPEPATTTLEQQLLAAQEQATRLSTENALLRDRLAEYQEIKGEGGVQPPAVVGRGWIFHRSLRQGRRFCELDLGAVDGVEKGMAVVAGWTLIGVVAGISDARCVVQQVTDSESRIPAALYRGQDNLLALTFVEDRPGLEVAVGMRVVTAGLAGPLPRGLVLGTVTAATRATGDHWRIEVGPLRSAETVDSLLVLRSAVVGPPSGTAGAESGERR
jgi:cell shape-determining protein MreC